jgi:hypothetical protein
MGTRDRPGGTLPKSMSPRRSWVVEDTSARESDKERKRRCEKIVASSASIGY